MAKRILAGFGLATALAISTLGLSACGGEENTTVVQPESATRGQQLMDLQRAYESGALSRREYEREREKVLRQK